MKYQIAIYIVVLFSFLSGNRASAIYQDNNFIDNSSPIGIFDSSKQRTSAWGDSGGQSGLDKEGGKENEDEYVDQVPVKDIPFIFILLMSTLYFIFIKLINSNIRIK